MAVITDASEQLGTLGCHAGGVIVAPRQLTPHGIWKFTEVFQLFLQKKDNFVDKMMDGRAPDVIYNYSKAVSDIRQLFNSCPIFAKRESHFQRCSLY